MATTDSRAGVTYDASTPRNKLVEETLRAHQWDHRAKGCSCGWSQKRTMKGMEQHNHPVHVAHMLGLAEATACECRETVSWNEGSPP